MKFATEYLWFNTKEKREYINITPRVEEGFTKKWNTRGHGSGKRHAYYCWCVGKRC